MKACFLFLVVLICAGNKSFAADNDADLVHYVCGEEAQEPDCTCEEGIVTCESSIFDSDTFKTANIVVVKPEFVAKNVTIGRALIPALKKGSVLPGSESTIEKLVISSDNLSTIEAGVFDKFDSLKSLSIYGTKLTGIGEGVFTEKLGKTLVELDLSDNNFTSISAIDFSKLTNLKSLKLNRNLGFRNSSSFLSDNFPRALANLESLSLSSCGLESLNSSIFANLTNLKTLYLGANPLNAMPTAINFVLNLENLYLDGTHIKLLNNTGLQNLENLEKLVMTDSQLTTIQDCAFCSFPNLKHFHFWRNPSLTSIHENAFGYAHNGTSPKIEAFSVEHCNLQIFPEKLLNWYDVQEIGIGGNNFMCNCSNAWLVNGVHDLKLGEIYRHPVEYGRYWYYDYRSRENALQCQLPVGLKDVHFTLIAGNLCKNETEDGQHDDEMAHHSLHMFFCGVIVGSIFFAVISFPIYRYFLKKQEANGKAVTPAAGFENDNFNEEADVQNDLP